MITLIGSSTNLLVSGSVFSSIGKEIGFFDFAKQGSFLALIGFFYAIFILPFILNLNKEENDKKNQGPNDEGRQFIVQIKVENTFCCKQRCTRRIFSNVRTRL